MPPFVLMLTGILILLITLYDLCRTTISLSGAGPITSWVCKPLWYLARRFHITCRAPRLLKAMGPVLALLLLVIWVVLSWFGWWLIFSSQPDAVVDSATYQTAGFLERAYFVGYTLTTLGYGDLVPLGAGWRITAIVTAINGFALFTLAVTYWLSIVSSVVKKRKLALFINMLGETPLAILDNTRDQGGFETLGAEVEKVIEEIIEIGQQQRAYPILHYYRTDHVREALPVVLTRIYIALQIVTFACPALPASTRFRISRGIRVLDDYFGNIDKSHTLEPGLGFDTQIGHDTGVPDLEKSPSEIDAYLEALPAKPLLDAYLAKECWQWEDVWDRHNIDNARSTKAK